MVANEPPLSYSQTPSRPRFPELAVAAGADVRLGSRTDYDDIKETLLALSSKQ